MRRLLTVAGVAAMVAAAAAVGGCIALVWRELPAIKRYIKIEKM